MTSFTVNHAVFPGISAVATRQADHLRAVRAYVESNTAIRDSCGFLLLPLIGQYEEARNIALTGLDQGGEICETVADRATQTGEQYATAEETCVNELRDAASGAVDVSGIRFTLPAVSGPPGACSPVADGTYSAISSSIPKWNDPLGDARTPLNVAQSITGSAVGRISPAPPDPTKQFTFKGIIDKLAQQEEARRWERLDAERGIPGAPPLRDRWEARLAARYGAAYNAGYSRTLNDQIVPGRGTWVANNMGPRTAQAGILALSTVTAVRGAWNNVRSLDTAVERDEFIQGVADGPANTDAIDWAR